MRLDAAPSRTGALYKNTNNQGGPIPIVAEVPQRDTPSNGDCMYAAIHRMYSAWQRSYPSSFQQMRASLQTFCDQNDQYVELPVVTDVPAVPDDPPTEPELSELQKWRNIAARQLELHWDRYDFALPGDPHSQRGEVDDALRWLHNPSPDDGPDDPVLRAQLQALLDDQPGGLPLADSQDPEERKRAMVEMTAKGKVYAYGIELDALAEVLGIFISTWFYSDPDPAAWVGAQQYRVHGPVGDEARDIAMRYMSGGYIPRFNLIKNQKHYSYQAVAHRGVANDRTKVQSARFYDGGDGGDPTAVDNAANEPGELNPQVVGGVRAHSGLPARGGGGGGGGGGGDDNDHDNDYRCAFSNANACFKHGKRWNACLPGVVHIRKPIADDWQIVSGDNVPQPTDEEREYVRERMQQAHDAFFEHWDSRANYGKIMLMTDPYQVQVVDGEVVVEEIDPDAGKTNVEKGNIQAKVTLADNTMITKAVAAIPLAHLAQVEAYAKANSPVAKNVSHNKFSDGAKQFRRIFYQTGLIDDANNVRILIALARWWRKQCSDNGYAPWSHTPPYDPREDYKPRSFDLKADDWKKGENLHLKGHPLKNSINHETPLPDGKKPKSKKQQKLLAKLATGIVSVHNETSTNKPQSHSEAASAFATWLDMVVYVLEQVLHIDLSGAPGQDEPEITEDILKARNK